MFSAIIIPFLANSITLFWYFWLPPHSKRGTPATMSGGSAWFGRLKLCPVPWPPKDGQTWPWTRRPLRWWNNGTSDTGIYQEFTRNLPGYTRNIPGYTRNVPGYTPGYTKNLPGIYQEFTRNLPGIYQDIPGIFQEYTRYGCTKLGMKSSKMAMYPTEMSGSQATMRIRGANRHWNTGHP